MAIAQRERERLMGDAPCCPADAGHDIRTGPGWPLRCDRMTTRTSRLFDDQNTMTAFIALALTAVLAWAAAAQTPLASIRGVVLDPAAMPVPGVQVAIVQADTGERRTVTADGTGRFVVAAIPSGTH